MRKRSPKRAMKAAARSLARRVIAAIAEPDDRQPTPGSKRLTMGRGSYADPEIVAVPGDTGRATVGQFCSIAHGVMLMLGGNHNTHWVTTYPFRIRYELPGAWEDGHPTSKGDIVIGNDVWIGRDARVMSGITIGHGAVVAAFSVVTKDVRPYSVVAGVPARERRRRFTDEQVEALLRIRWWDWPMERILDSVPQLCSGNIDGFIAAHDPGRSATAGRNG